MKRKRLTLAEKHPRYGCPLLHGMLSLEGLAVNRKRAYRHYNEVRPHSSVNYQPPAVFARNVA